MFAALFTIPSLFSLLLVQLQALPVDYLRNETTIQLSHRRLTNELFCNTKHTGHWSLGIETIAGGKQGAISGCATNQCMMIFENVTAFDDEVRRGTVNIKSAQFRMSKDEDGHVGIGTKQALLYPNPYCIRSPETVTLREGRAVEFERYGIYRSFMIANAGLYWQNSDPDDEDLGMGMTEGDPKGEEWWEDLMVPQKALQDEDEDDL
ncbi:MAG: hypothetical protein Q9162_002012 [Coniocarpon cinnabarinum]